MGNAAFVLIAVGVAALASLLLWAAHRRPRTFMSSIEDFQREMKAPVVAAVPELSFPDRDGSFHRVDGEAGGFVLTEDPLQPRVDWRIRIVPAGS